MRVRGVAIVSFIIAVAAAPASAWAQQASLWDVGVAAAVVQYDLSGVGTAPGLVIRGSRTLSPHVVFEARGLFAWPDQQSGPSTFLVPEAQLQYRWNVARFSPYVGAGGGFARTSSPLRTHWDPTFSFAAGTGIQLTDGVGITGEFRLRGVETRFTGTTAEWSAGMTWRLPSF